VTLELSRLTQTVQDMGRELERRERVAAKWAEQARDWLREFAHQGDVLRNPAREFRAAVPLDEPLDTALPPPSAPQRFTVIGSDGAQIPPDRHGLALYYLINVGSLVYRHGSGQTPEARTVPQLYYRQEDLYDGATLVSGGLLGVRRDRAELAQLADLVEVEAERPVLALVDGTLLLWVSDDLAPAVRKQVVDEYLDQLERIRQAGAGVAAFTSRPRATEVGRLLHLASLGGDVRRAKQEPNPLERIADEMILSHLPPGARSALFASSRALNGTHYAPAGHEILFFYVNVAAEGEEPEVARVEVPTWVGAAAEMLGLVHAGVVAQSRIAGGFPYVLARADELAYISGPERQRLEEMVGTALLAAGLSSVPSSKALYKSMTRGGRRW
jgi:hypothetical protein